MATVICLITNILQNIFFCVQQKKSIQTGWGWVKEFSFLGELSLEMTQAATDLLGCCHFKTECTDPIFSVYVHY